MYADDMATLAPPPSGLQKLLNICTEYAKKYEIKYNVQKSLCMCILPVKSRNKVNTKPKISLCVIIYNL